MPGGADDVRSWIPHPPACRTGASRSARCSGARAGFAATGMACFFALAACETSAPSPTLPSSALGAERWEITSRGEDELATIANSAGYTLALGCGATGESGRYMEVLRDGQMIGDPPEYVFEVFTGVTQIHRGGVEMISVPRNDGGTTWYPTVSIEAVDALRSGGRVDIVMPGGSTQSFGLAGSLVAIDATAC